MKIFITIGAFLLLVAAPEANAGLLNCAKSWYTSWRNIGQQAVRPHEHLNGKFVKPTNPELSFTVNSKSMTFGSPGYEQALVYQFDQFEDLSDRAYEGAIFNQTGVVDGSVVARYRQETTHPNMFRQEMVFYRHNDGTMRLLFVFYHRIVFEFVRDDATVVTD